MREQKLTTYQLTVIALITAALCILGPLSIPIGAVPISLTNLLIYFAVYLLGTKLGTLSYMMYLLLGMAGLPVFSAYSGGLAKLAGPTGGYLIGFIPMAIIIGLFLEKSKGNRLVTAVGMVLGTSVAYLLGTIWFVFQMQCEVWYALTICVFPFLLGDGVKIAIAITVGPMLRHRLQQAGVLTMESDQGRAIK